MNLEKQLPEPLYSLSQRLGEEKFVARMMAQSSHWAMMQHQGEGVFVVEKYIPIDTLVNLGLALTLTKWWGYRNFLDIRKEYNRVMIQGLDSGLAGYRILHLSDLHADLDVHWQTCVKSHLKELKGCYDLAVITGDYRNSTRSNFHPALEIVKGLLSSIDKPVYGILGNHDFIEMVPDLENAGLKMLLNEFVTIDYKGSQILLAGVDDPHFYQTHDLDKLTPKDSPSVFKMLLSHSPEIYREAAGYFDFMLSGHTHGGQICLPGGYPLINNGNCPKNMIKGAWKYDGLSGYTSRGTGSCGVPARFFCPPEITIHTLEIG